MRKFLMFLVLLLCSTVAFAQGQSCLRVLKQQPTFCPKCSDPGAGGGTAGKLISEEACLSCGFYCWYALTAQGGKYTFKAATNAPISPIPQSDADSPGCRPSDVERDRVLSQAIPLALNMKRSDFEKLAADSPVAASVIAMMLWRGEDASMTNAREFIAQLRGRPSYEDAMALYDNYEKRITQPWSIKLAKESFLHIEVSGSELAKGKVQLTVSTTLIAGQSKTLVDKPTIIEVDVGDDEVPVSFAGQLVVAKQALATYRH